MIDYIWIWRIAIAVIGGIIGGVLCDFFTGKR